MHTDSTQAVSPSPRNRSDKLLDAASRAAQLLLADTDDFDATIREVAKKAKIKVDEARQDFVDNLHPW